MERCLTDGDEDGEWSYSTALSSQPMDLLRERFGEASFCDVGAWKRVDTEAEGLPTWKARRQSTQQLAVPSARFHLASPKFLLHGGHGRTREGQPLRGPLPGPSFGGYSIHPSHSQGEGTKMGDSGHPWIPHRLASLLPAQQWARERRA